MKEIPISEFTWGMEMENYVPEWRTDHDDTHETISRVFKKFNGVLVYARNIVERHKDDEDFVLHSYPSDYDSSCSAHIHFKANIPDWWEYAYDLYTRVYDLVAIFQFFFKNSPKHNGLSMRHGDNHWCILQKVSKERFRNISRDYLALTPNRGIGTLEFRYNDVPKSLHQLSMFYYLVYIASKPSIRIPAISYFVNTLNDLEGRENTLFSYNDEESLKAYKDNIGKRMISIAQQIAKQMKGVKFYDFYREKYVSFGKLVSDAYDYEVGLFRSYDHDDYAWSNNLKKSFYKKVKRELIKISEPRQRNEVRI